MRPSSRAEFWYFTTPQPHSTVEIAARLLRFHALLALARRIYGSVDDLGHINLLTPTALRLQLKDLGFEILESTRRGLYIPCSPNSAASRQTAASGARTRFGGTFRCCPGYFGRSATSCAKLAE